MASVTVYTSKCPYCGAVMERSTVGGPRLGSPLQQCAKCQQSVLASKSLEWEMLPGSAVAGEIFGCFMAGVLLGALVGGATLFSNWGRTSSLLGIPNCVFVGLAVAIVIWILMVRMMRENIQKSKQRMTDPAYRQSLASLGLDVPDARPRLLHALKHGEEVTAVAFSRQGVLATGGKRGQVVLWDSSAGTQLRRLTGHQGKVATLAFAPDGRRLASGSEDGTVRVWDVDAGREAFRIAEFQDVRHVEFSPDGAELLAAGSTKEMSGHAALWNAHTGAKVRTIGKLTMAVFSRDGKQLLRPGNETIEVFDAATGEKVREMGTGMMIDAVVEHPDGRHALVGLYNNGGRVVLWDMQAGRALQSCQRLLRSVKSLAPSPNGRWALSTGTIDSVARIWDLQSGTYHRSLLHPSRQWITAAAFSHDGERVATAGNDKYACVWDPAF